MTNAKNNQSTHVFEGTEGIQPFRIHISDQALQDLQQRLHQTRYPELPDAGWERGAPLSYVRELADYWRDEFDWRQQEARLNEFPQYLTSIDGQQIHFLHIKSTEPNAKPLMLIHGWPGSFVEFLDVIGPLTNPRAYDRDRVSNEAYHLVIPSIPGFGFSAPLHELGWTNERIAQAFLTLMDRLGYDRFGVQGGDTGAFIAPEMGRLAPDRIIGIHMNALLTFPTGEEGELDGLSEEEQVRLGRFETFNDGYLQIQSKSPHTLAYALHDSPIGQLAWIAEIFAKWTNPVEALPEEIIDRDRLLTNISLYWFCGVGGSAAQIYYESIQDPNAWLPKDPVTVPTGVLVSLSHDTSVRRLADKEFHIVHWTECAYDGHFYAMEQPERYVEDVRSFFQELS